MHLLFGFTTSWLVGLKKDLLQSTALWFLITSRFTFSDIRSSRIIRSHIQEIMSYARLAEFDKEYNIILLIWNSLDLTMQRHINEPRREVILA
jgi:hypothetical protein